LAAANTDKFKKLARKWTGAIGSGGVANDSTTTIPLASSTNLPTDTAVVAVIDRVDANGTKTPSLEESVIGVVSGSNLVTCTRGVEGTAQAHSAGAVVEILFTNKGWEDLIDGILAEHNQAGAHTTDTISEKTAAAGVTIDGLQIKDGVGVYTDKAPKINVKARAYLSAAQEDLVSDVFTKILLDAEDYDTGSDFDVGNHEFVVPIDGYYLITFGVRFDNVVVNKNYQVSIFIGETGKFYARNQAAIADDVLVSGSDIMNLSAGEKVSLRAYHNAGVNTVDIYGSPYYTMMAIHLLSI